MTTYQTMADPTAVMGRRIGGWIVDVLIGTGIGIAVFLATVSVDEVDANLCAGLDFGDDGITFESDDSSAEFCTVEAPNGDDYFAIWDGDTTQVFKTGEVWVVYGASLLYGLLVAVLWQGLSGMTVGKALFGVRTVNQDGQAPGIGKAFIRTILWIVDGIGCCIPLVAPIAAFTSKGHRRVGDMAAKTYVVDKSYMGGGPIQIPGVTPPPAAAYGATGPTWGTAPPMTPPTTPAGAGTVATPPAAGEPQWDAARNAYIQWDAAQQKWLQFDDATQQWRPID